MVEGQEGVTWEQWVALVQACEEAGLDGMFRSDHYLSVDGHPERGALDAWTTLAALSTVTRRIKLGTMVSPVTFRHPSLLAKIVATADHVSGGRVELGMGAGWLEPEHRAYGFPFPNLPTRLELLEEQIEIVHRAWQEGGFGFRGRHYTVEGLDARPKPAQRPHPNLIVGGFAARRSAALAARWADEYNTSFATPETCRERRARVSAAWKQAGRDPETLVFSLMTGCVVGSDRQDVRQRTRRIMERRGERGSEEAWQAERHPEWVVGTPDVVVDQLRAFEHAGVQRFMLQLQLHDDLEMIYLIGEIASGLR